MSTIVSLGGPQGAPLTIGGLGTTQKIFQAPKTGLVVSAVSDYLLALPGGNRLNGKVFAVRATGNVFVHGTTPTFQLQLLGSILGVTNVILAQTAAVTLTTAANYDWAIEALLFGSSAPSVTTVPGGAGALVGQFSSNINGTVGAQATLTNNLTGITFGPTSSATGPGTPNEPIAYLKVAGLFTPTDALQLASLTEFVVYDVTGTVA